MMDRRLACHILRRSPIGSVPSRLGAIFAVATFHTKPRHDTPHHTTPHHDTTDKRNSSTTMKVLLWTWCLGSSAVAATPIKRTTLRQRSLLRVDDTSFPKIGDITMKNFWEEAEVKMGNRELKGSKSGKKGRGSKSGKKGSRSKGGKKSRKSFESSDLSFDIFMDLQSMSMSMAPVTTETSTSAPRTTTFPTSAPLATPTLPPLPVPTDSPVDPTNSPTVLSGRLEPETMPPVEVSTSSPTLGPVETTTSVPTNAMTSLPTGSPTSVPTSPPTTSPIEISTSAPTSAATGFPTQNPTTSPTTAPTTSPTNSSSSSPSINLAGRQSIQTRIEAFALQGGSEFLDVTSYQSAALERVEAQVGAQSMSDEKLVQYYSLYCVLESTYGKSNAVIETDPNYSGADIPGWKVSTGWFETNLDPCDGWFGVDCENDQVVTLNLYDNELSGDLAPEVKLLASDGPYSTGAGNLRLLDLFNNNLLSNGGDSSWVTDLGSNLQYLYIQATSFAGDLPPFPTGLVELDLSSTLISGGLVGSNFVGLDELKFLLLDGCQFSTSIPTELASLPNLEYFYASDAMITGDLSYMSAMPSIFEHFVANNPNLGGPLFSFIGDLQTLNSFSVAGCSFEGTIPTEFGKFPVMQQLWLNDNQLSGSVPEELGTLLFMSTFEVEGNSLTGTMPGAICNNFDIGFLGKLGADCSDVDCECCTCCSSQECRESD